MVTSFQFSKDIKKNANKKILGHIFFFFQNSSAILAHRLTTIMVLLKEAKFDSL